MRGEDDKRYEALAKWIGKLRTSRGLSTHDFARATKRPQPWLWEVEVGRRLPGIFDVMRVARAFNIRGHGLTGMIEELLDDGKLADTKAPRPPARKQRPPLAKKPAKKPRLPKRPLE